jgi:ubiquinone/menaquinone biosynthesis C-methylase UbiE
MKVPLQMGKQKLPMATFQPADIEQSLPFEDNTFHCILASRLLVHVVDLPKACDELIRVLKPGGLFICCEANMDVSMQLLTTDRRLQGNLQTKVQHMTKMCANPDAATLAYIINIFRHVRQPVVDIQSYSCVVPQPKHMDPTLIMDTQFLSKLVESGELAAEDQDTICGIMLLEEMNTVPPPTET